MGLFFLVESAFPSWTPQDICTEWHQHLSFVIHPAWPPVSSPLPTPNHGLPVFSKNATSPPAPLLPPRQLIFCIFANKKEEVWGEYRSIRRNWRENNVLVLFIYCLGWDPWCDRTEFVAKYWKVAYTQIISTNSLSYFLLFSNHPIAPVQYPLKNETTTIKLQRKCRCSYFYCHSVSKVTVYYK